MNRVSTEPWGLTISTFTVIFQEFPEKFRASSTDEFDTFEKKSLIVLMTSDDELQILNSATPLPLSPNFGLLMTHILKGANWDTSTKLLGLLCFQALRIFRWDSIDASWQQCFLSYQSPTNDRFWERLFASTDIDFFFLQNQASPNCKNVEKEMGEKWTSKYFSQRYLGRIKSFSDRYHLFICFSTNSCTKNK